jgi:hypothetical protein
MTEPVFESAKESLPTAGEEETSRSWTAWSLFSPVDEFFSAVPMLIRSSPLLRGGFCTCEAPRSRGSREDMVSGTLGTREVETVWKRSLLRCGRGGKRPSASSWGAVRGERRGRQVVSLHHIDSCSFESWYTGR